jgi:hypothetical protein
MRLRYVTSGLAFAGAEDRPIRDGVGKTDFGGMVGRPRCPRTQPGCRERARRLFRFSRRRAFPAGFEQGAHYATVDCSNIVSVQRVASGAGEIPRQNRVDIFVGPPPRRWRPVRWLRPGSDPSPLATRCVAFSQDSPPAPQDMKRLCSASQNDGAPDDHRPGLARDSGNRYCRGDRS